MTPTKFGTSIIAASILLFAHGISHGASDGDPGGPCVIPNYDAATGPFSAPPGWSLTPDRRPVYVIRPWVGHGSNKIGLRPEWYDQDIENPSGPPTDSNGDGIPDVFDWLLNELDQAYDRGYRRIVLRVPAGGLPDSIMASAQWWTLAPWKRSGFQSHVEDWLDAKAAAGDPVTLGLYLGYEIKDPCSLDMTNSYNPDPMNQADMNTFYANIKPWMDVGVEEFWLDASGSDWQTMSTLQFSPDYYGLARFGGEAIPNQDDPNAPPDEQTGPCSGHRIPVPNLTTSAPFVGIFRFVWNRFRNDTDFPDPNTTELSVMFTGHAATCGTGTEWKFEHVRQLVEDGWVPWMDRHNEVNQWAGQSLDYSFEYATEAIYRIYDYGQLEALIDFNGDGLIQVEDNTYPVPRETKDIDDFLAAYNSGPIPRSGEYLDGDVNGDGTVNVKDYNKFFNAADNWLNNGTLKGVNLGQAPWVP